MIVNRFLTMFEVSQKQSYIFGSNRLKENIINSSVIAWIMSPEYFEVVIDDETIFNKKDNLVYSGGGHIILEFSTKEKAVDFSKKITFEVHKCYPDIELFTTTMEYDCEKNPGDNLKKLTAKLETKKSVRSSVFHQGTFGVEKIDASTLKSVLPEMEEKTDKELMPAGYHRACKFEELGGTKNEHNFIAVIHIDGNAMGKRVEKLIASSANLSWEEYKRKMQSFSKAIDQDFKSAYKDMNETVVRNIESQKLDCLDLKEEKFPVRRIITAGDDICFVSDGRIGIECAVSFIKSLNSQKNAEDQEGYSACAGVAIVHQKYPFYRAYELAEMLCGNAKKFGASLSADGTGSDISAIDWHIEYGEMKDNLEEIRQEYETLDEKRLEMRPYIVCASDRIKEMEPVRNYANFRKLVKKIQNNEISYARGKMKELRSVLKRGEKATGYYLEFNKIEDIMLESYQEIYKKISIDQIGSGKGLERKIFLETADGMERSILFDALEVSDTFIDLD